MFTFSDLYSVVVYLLFLLLLLFVCRFECALFKLELSFRVVIDADFFVLFLFLLIVR